MALSNPFNPPPNTPLLPDPQRDSIWRRWFEQLYKRTESGATGGTVTSVAVSGGATGLTTSGGPITTSGTITIAGTLDTANGGTGLTAAGTVGNVLTSDGTDWVSSPPTGGGSDLLIVYNNEDLDIATNTQVTGHADLTFQGTGNLVIDGTGSLEIVGGDTAGLEAATQSEMEAGTSNTVATTPGRQQYHPSASKAWINFDGTAGTPAAAASYNVSSITDNGSGDWTINFTTSFSSANYGFALSSRTSDGDTNRAIACPHSTTAPTASAFSIQMRATGSGAGTAPDSTLIGATFFGDQ